MCFFARSVFRLLGGLGTLEKVGKLTMTGVQAFRETAADNDSLSVLLKEAAANVADVHLDSSTVEKDFVQLFDEHQGKYHTGANFLRRSRE